MKKLFLMMLILFTVSILSKAENKGSKIASIDTTRVEKSQQADSLIINEVESVTDSTESSDWINLLSEIADNIVPLTGIVFIFGFPVLIVLIVFSYQHKKRKAQYELIAKAIEAGKDIPEGFLETRKSEVKNSFTTGIINTFAGVGLAILLWALVSLKFASIGLLITCIGIGQIIIYQVMHKPAGQNKESENAENSKRLPE